MKRLGRIIAAFGFFLIAQTAQADWGPVRRLTWTPDFSERPAIAVDSSGCLHVVWHDRTPGNFEIYYKMSMNGGGDWTPAKRLTWTSGSSQNPALVIDAVDKLHMAWQDYTSGNWEILYKQSINGGATWTTNQRLSWNSGRSEAPVVSAGPSNTIHVCWNDDTPGNYEIYHKTSTDGGITWAASRRLTQTSGASQNPAMAVDSSGLIHLFWHDTTHGYDIYYKKSTDDGTQWTSNQRLTWNSGGSYYPRIGVDASAGLHVVWQDHTPGNYEIFFRKGK